MSSSGDRTMRWRALVLLLFLNGCVGHSLEEVRATVSHQTGTFPAIYEQLATCAKHRIETDTWIFGRPVVQSTSDPSIPLVSVYAIYSRSTLFELTFQPAPSAMTLVKYRRGYDGHGTREKTWAIIIEGCSQEVPIPSNQSSDIPPQSLIAPTSTITAH